VRPPRLRLAGLIRRPRPVGRERVNSVGRQVFRVAEPTTGTGETSDRSDEREVS
jgi:hypothetical protein